jgi:DNA primase
VRRTTGTSRTLTPLVTPTTEREARLAELHQRLTDQVRALATGDDWARWLAVAARFPTYSVNNTLLILAQRPDATLVAGYHAWRQVGRHVDKGQRGIAILAPITRKVDPQQSTDGEETGRRIVGYRPTYVWDVSQTSGQPLPKQPSAELLTGQAPDGLWDELAANVGHRGFTLHRGPCGQANGLTDFAARSVRVRSDVDDAQAVKTLAHELGHVLLHDGTSRPECRGIAEVEAESVAYLVTASRGLASDAYTFPYVTSWAAHVPGTSLEDVILQVAARVQQAARQILDSPPTPAEPPARDRSPSVTPAQDAAAGTGRHARVAEPHQRGAQDQPKPTARLVAVHADAAAFYRHQLPGSWVPAYLGDRALAEVLKSTRWDVGYAPGGWTSLVEHLRALGHDDATLELSGLALRLRNGHLVDRFRDRLTLPIRNDRGDTVGFVARAQPHASARTPKYLNSPNTPIYSKSARLLQPLMEQGVRQRTPVLVEGPLDAMAISVASPDLHTPIALCGTAVTADHVRLVAEAAGGPGAPVLLAVDADPAGRRSAQQSYRRLTAAGLQCWATALPEGADPADLLAGPDGASRLRAALTQDARPLIDDLVDARIGDFFDSLRWVEGRVGLVRCLAPDLALLPADQLDRQVHRLCARVDIAEETVAGEVDRCRGVTFRESAVHGLPTVASQASTPSPCCSLGVPRRAAL